MENEMLRSGYGCYNGSDSYDSKAKACDIVSVCCNNFVKEQFSLKTVATNNVVMAYQSTDGNITRGTVKVQNLSSNTSINFTVNSTNIVVGPNQEAAITAANLASVKVQSIGQGTSAKVKLCFDLQVS